MCFSAWLDMGFCERREGGLGSVAGCGCDYLYDGGTRRKKLFRTKLLYKSGPIFDGLL